nr:unnamed protein product [Trichobilharzia regenti]
MGVGTTLLIIKLIASFQSESRFYTNSTQNEKPDDNPRHLPLIFIGGHQSSEFLDLPWDDRLLQHEKYIHNISMLNKYEASSVQVVKPIHLESLTAWSRNGSVIPKEYISTMHMNSRLLKKLGYATNEIPPNYEDLCKVDSVL